MAAVIDVAGQRWVGGLVWRSFESRPNRHELQTDAADLDADWLAERVRDSAIQVGFCAAVDGVRSPRGLHALAAAVADAYPQPWMGIYQVGENLCWLIAVRGGQAILPRGDVIGTQDDIAAAADSYSEFEDWTYIHGTLADLSAILRRRAVPRAAVRSVHALPPWVRPAALVAAMLVIAVGTGVWWEAQRAAQEREALLARQMAERARLADLQRLRLESSPTPASWMAACDRGLASLPASVGGWRLEKFDCSGSASRVVWKRGPGATPGYAPAGVLTVADGQTITQTINFAGLVPGHDNAVALDRAEAVFYNLLLPTGAVVRLDRPSPAVALPGVVPQQPRLASVGFKVTLPISPFGLPWQIVPGLVFESVGAAGSVWNVAGTIYGR